MISFAPRMRQPGDFFHTPLVDRAFLSTRRPIWRVGLTARGASFASRHDPLGVYVYAFGVGRIAKGVPRAAARLVSPNRSHMSPWRSSRRVLRAGAPGPVRRGGPPGACRRSAARGFVGEYAFSPRIPGPRGRSPNRTPAAHSARRAVSPPLAKTQSAPLRGLVSARRIQGASAPQSEEHLTLGEAFSVGRPVSSGVSGTTEMRRRAQLEGKPRRRRARRAHKGSRSSHGP